MPNADAYNPEEDVETWDSEGAWNQPPPRDLETPESPPLFEKEGFADPIEYDDAKNERTLGKQDIDQRRILLPPPIPPGMLNGKVYLGVVCFFFTFVNRFGET